MTECKMIDNMTMNNHSEPQSQFEPKRVSSRKRIKSTRYSGDEYNLDDSELDGYMDDVRQIKIEDEKYVWDFFYANDKTSNYPFSGFNTMDTVNMITEALAKLRVRNANHLVFESDVIIEVGHGKFPLIWDLRDQFGDFMYFGIEFSSVALREAVKQRFENKNPEDVFDRNVEFLCPRSLKYFNPDGTSNLDLVFAMNYNESRLVPSMGTLVFGKCFLDYLSSRLSLSLSFSNWKSDPRIPQGVVDMFDSVSTALKDKHSDQKNPPLFILVEPDDIVKFKDHIGIITKVIYTSTFIKDSSSKYLKLAYVQRHKNFKAVCFGLIKTKSVYKDYEELRSDVCRVAKNAYSDNESKDEDWLLPHTIPPKWLSNDSKDFDNLILL